MKKILILLLFGFVVNANAQDFYDNAKVVQHQGSVFFFDVQSGTNTVEFIPENTGNKVRIKNQIDLHTIFALNTIHTRQQFFNLLDTALSATEGAVIIVPPYKSFAQHNGLRSKEGSKLVATQIALPDTYQKAFYTLQLVLDGLAHYFDANEVKGRKITVSAGISLRGLGSKALAEAMIELEDYVKDAKNATYPLEPEAIEEDIVDDSKLEEGNVLDKVFEAFEKIGLAKILRTQIYAIKRMPADATKYDRLIAFLSTAPEMFKSIPATATVVIGDVEKFSELEQNERIKFLEHRALGVSLERTRTLIKK